MEILRTISEYVLYILLIYGIIGFIYSLKYTKKINRLGLFDDSLEKTVTRWFSALFLSLLFIIFDFETINILWLYPLCFLLSFTPISTYISGLFFIGPILKIFHDKDMTQEFYDDPWGQEFKKTSDFLSTGERLCQVGNFTEAIKYLKMFADKNANDYRPYSVIGYCYRQLVSMNAGWVDNDINLPLYIENSELSIKYYSKSVQILINNHSQIDKDFYLVNFDLSRLIEVYVLKRVLYDKFKYENPFNHLVRPLPFNEKLLSSLLVYCDSTKSKYNSLVNELKNIRGYFN